MVPTFLDYEHNGTMTVFNDANGYLYAAIADFIMQNNSSKIDSGVTGDKHYKGSVITLNSVRFSKIDGLNFSYSGGEPSKI